MLLQKAVMQACRQKVMEGREGLGAARSSGVWFSLRATRLARLCNGQPINLNAPPSLKIQSQQIVNGNCLPEITWRGRLLQ